MRNPRLNHLKAFDASARHLNFRKAAEELHITQGAVAQSVRGLEEDLGVKLFRRLARGLALTERGKLYHTDIASGLSLIDQATRKLQAGARQLTVSVTPSFASKWLVPNLPHFFELNPGVEIRTIASEVVTDFQSDDVDLAIRIGPRPSDKSLRVAKLAEEDLCIVAGSALASQIGTSPEFEALRPHPLIQEGHRHWEGLMSFTRGCNPGVVMQFNQTALAIEAAANGQGLAVVPRLLARNELVSGRLVELLQLPVHDETGFWLVHPVSDPANKPLRDAFTA